jgi:hypothetical protein
MTAQIASLGAGYARSAIGTHRTWHAAIVEAEIDDLTFAVRGALIEAADGATAFAPAGGLIIAARQHLDRGQFGKAEALLRDTERSLIAARGAAATSGAPS